MKTRISIIYKLNDEDFIALVKKSESLCDVVKHFGLSINGSGGFTVVKRRIKDLGIDCTHIAKIIREKRQKNFLMNRIASLDNILIENSTYASTHNLKKKLVRCGLLANCCSVCGINSWNGKHLSLQIDHINGVKTDNRIANLRLLCPNCHSQTPNYAGKKNEQPRAKHYCLKCGSEITIYSKSGLCSKCCLEITHSQNRTTQESYCINNKVLNSGSGTEINLKELENDILLLGWEATGRKHGVCGNAIKKWAKKYGLNIVGQRDFRLSISSSVCADFKNNKMSLKELSKKYGTSTYRIRSFLLGSGLVQKNAERKYKYGVPGIVFDNNRGDYACYIHIDKKDKFLKRGFKTPKEAIDYRNYWLSVSNGISSPS